ncbi:hypothetical protein AAG906_036420 [Vitis piasezkii]
MEDDGINREIGGKQLEGVWNGEGDSDHGDSDENSRPRFPSLTSALAWRMYTSEGSKFASHVVFKEALKEWCIKEKHDFEYKHNDKWRVTVNSKISSRWLANKYLPFFRDDHTWTANALKGAVFRDHEVDVTLDQCYKAKRMAFKMIHGLRRRSGMWVAVKIQTTNDVFERMYIWDNGERLLVLVGKDGNDNIFPIAFAIVEIENKSSWTWFLQCLLDDIGHVDENGWGLVETFKDLMPNAEHRFCVRHLHANFKKDFPGKVLKDAMWSAARATTKNSFDFHMDELKKLDVKAYEWLVKLDSFNGWILEARDKPVLTMMEIIRVMLMQSEVGHCISLWNGESKYEVEYIYGGRYVVDLNERTCGCGRWGLSGIPCFHVFFAIIEHGEQLETYVDIAYTKETFLSSPKFTKKVGKHKKWGHNQRTCKAPDNPNKKAYKKKKKGQLEQSSTSGAKGSKKLLGTQQSNIGTQQSSQSRTKDNTSGSKKDKGKAKV